MNPPESGDDVRLVELLDEAVAELRAGRRPDTAPWQVQYPGLGDELLALLELLCDLEGAAEGWRPTPAPADTTRPETAPLADATEAPLPPQVGRYRILAKVGAGGMGTVYQAHDPQLDRVVALKVPRLGGEPDRPRAVQRFLREARAAARVRHAHVCPIYDVGEHEGLPYVVMAYVEGRSLADRLAGGRRLDPRPAAVLARQVAEALEAVHRHGIVHRDLKPANVLLDQAGEALLADFGLARPEHEPEHITAEGIIVGTPAYMAPEQAVPELGPVGPWTDVYSLGVVLYHMLAGRPPFEGSPLQVLARLANPAPPLLSHFPDGIDPALKAIALRALARQPADRYRSARELADALDGWLAGALARPGEGSAGEQPAPVTLPSAPGAGLGTPLSARGERSHVTLRQRRRWHSPRVAVGLLLFLLVGGLLTISVRLRDSERSTRDEARPMSFAEGPEANWHAQQQVADVLPEPPQDIHEIAGSHFDIRFYPNSADLHKKVLRKKDGKDVEELYDPDVEATLAQIARLVETFGAAQVVIEGHTDASVKSMVPASDLPALAAEVKKLSEARAQAVKRALVEKYRIDPSRVIVKGAGWDRPADLGNPNDQARNRRIEVRVFAQEPP